MTFQVVIQEYDTDFHKAYVINGNDALLKCEIPSFVADFVTVESWIDSNENEYFAEVNTNYGNCSAIIVLVLTKYKFLHIILT